MQRKKKAKLVKPWRESECTLDKKLQNTKDLGVCRGWRRRPRGQRQQFGQCLTVAVPWRYSAPKVFCLPRPLTNNCFMKQLLLMCQGSYQYPKRQRPFDSRFQTPHCSSLSDNSNHFRLLIQLTNVQTHQRLLPRLISFSYMTVT